MAVAELVAEPVAVPVADAVPVVDGLAVPLVPGEAVAVVVALLPPSPPPQAAKASAKTAASELQRMDCLRLIVRSARRTAGSSRDSLGIARTALLGHAERAEELGVLLQALAAIDVERLARHQA